MELAQPCDSEPKGQENHTSSGVSGVLESSLNHAHINGTREKKKNCKIKEAFKQYRRLCGFTEAGGRRAGGGNSLLSDLVLAPLWGLDCCLQVTWLQDKCYFSVLAEPRSSSVPNLEFQVHSS